VCKEIEVITAEAAAEESEGRTQEFAASGEDNVKHVTQRAVVPALERLEYPLHLG
jgi:hypothetical protein